jgi:hypothetical protein
MRAAVAAVPWPPNVSDNTGAAEWIIRYAWNGSSADFIGAGPTYRPFPFEVSEAFHLDFTAYSTASVARGHIAVNGQSLCLARWLNRHGGSLPYEDAVGLTILPSGYSAEFFPDPLTVPAINNDYANIVRIYTQGDGPCTWPP